MPISQSLTRITSSKSLPIRRINIHFIQRSYQDTRTVKEEQRNPFPKRFLVASLLLVLIAGSAFTVDRYRHAKHQKDALAELASLGLNHEFDVDRSFVNGISFYSTGDAIAHAPSDEVLRHLRTLSKSFNGGLRYGYVIERVDLSNCVPTKQLLQDIRETFPEAEIELRHPDRT